jgi:hypothetical protein
MEWVGNNPMPVVCGEVYLHFLGLRFLPNQGRERPRLQRNNCVTALTNLDGLNDAHRRWRYETGEKAAVRA